MVTPLDLTLAHRDEYHNDFPASEDFFQTKKEPTVRWANGLRIDKLLSIQLLAEC
ncbi:hypothetical protein Kkor_0608 [Kangiella koreensis DSM 16069]|uniref:Uncharacterized protein n=1 Tax=Kangiella koreensis (strain DSM 16069 / JCM 12317 / KCTC 12182 / SW-125) TaxID=523791 RepID=C7R9D7_KANKD|nr:hypothetical protein Kkor_0608 [Kangiella koreensis DSM 16069]